MHVLIISCDILHTVVIRLDHIISHSASHSSHCGYSAQPHHFPLCFSFFTLWLFGLTTSFPTLLLIHHTVVIRLNHIISHSASHSSPSNIAMLGFFSNNMLENILNRDWFLWFGALTTRDNFYFSFVLCIIYMLIFCNSNKFRHAIICLQKFEENSFNSLELISLF